ncbi:hypothetical protein TNCV_2424321, partial [Trichonephila clavipes]
NFGGRTGKILRPSSVPLKSKNQEINRLQLAVKLPWAIFFESAEKSVQSIFEASLVGRKNPCCPVGGLKFEAFTGSDLSEQASISFTKEGVKFNKYENHAQLMQISAENLQEELDLRHIEYRHIKNELEKC